LGKIKIAKNGLFLLFDRVKDRNNIKHSTNVDIQPKTLARKLWSDLIIN
jgi:hypothetical protein